MLIETAPVDFTTTNWNPNQLSVSPDDSPVVLVNKAWQVFVTKPINQYMDWEYASLKSWLA
jgi:hypothetical protein